MAGEAGIGQKAGSWLGRYWDKNPKMRKWMVMGAISLFTGGGAAVLGKDPRNGLVFIFQAVIEEAAQRVAESMEPRLRAIEQNQNVLANNMMVSMEYLSEMKEFDAAREVVQRRKREDARRRERIRSMLTEPLSADTIFPFDPRVGIGPSLMDGTFGAVQ